MTTINDDDMFKMSMTKNQNKNVKLFYSPYHMYGNQSLSASKLSFANAPILYPPNTAEIESANMAPPKQDTRNLRYQLNSQQLTNYIPGASQLEEKEKYHNPRRMGGGGFHATRGTGNDLLRRDQYHNPRRMGGGGFHAKIERFTADSAGAVVFFIICLMILIFTVIGMWRGIFRPRFRGIPLFRRPPPPPRS